MIGQIPSYASVMNDREPNPPGSTARELPLPKGLGVNDEGLVQDRRLLGAASRKALYSWAPPETSATLFYAAILAGLVLLCWHHHNRLKTTGHIGKAPVTGE